VVVVAGILMLAALGAYWNSFNVPFLLDDKVSIEGNPSIRASRADRGCSFADVARANGCAAAAQFIPGVELRRGWHVRARIPRRQSAHSYLRRAHAAGDCAPHAVFAGIAPSLWRGGPAVGRIRRPALDAASAANGSRDVYQPAGRIADGSVLPADAVWLHPFGRCRAGSPNPASSDGGIRPVRWARGRRSRPTAIRHRRKQSVARSLRDRLPLRDGHETGHGNCARARAALRPGVRQRIVSICVGEPALVLRESGGYLAVAWFSDAPFVVGGDQRGVSVWRQLADLCGDGVACRHGLPAARVLAASVGVRLWQ
jgi:hypothetical protein